MQFLFAHASFELTQAIAPGQNWNGRLDISALICSRILGRIPIDDVNPNLEQAQFQSRLADSTAMALMLHVDAAPKLSAHRLESRS